jgi:3-deoxy-D-arabino-heptulosonate 7-phosphate (DAHP) synthase
MSTLDLTATVHKIKRPTSLEVNTHIGRFTARYDYLYAALAVLATATGVDGWIITEYPGVETVQATSDDGGFTMEYKQDYTFYGGQTYTVTGSLATALSDAGYTVN